MRIRSEGGTGRSSLSVVGRSVGGIFSYSVNELPACLPFQHSNSEVSSHDRRVYSKAAFPSTALLQDRDLER
jgi:hypothetical protein